MRNWRLLLFAVLEQEEEELSEARIETLKCHHPTMEYTHFLQRLIFFQDGTVLHEVA